jgi:hypothetical protein
MYFSMSSASRQLLNVKSGDAKPYRARHPTWASRISAPRGQSAISILRQAAGSPPRQPVHHTLTRPTLAGPLPRADSRCAIQFLDARSAPSLGSCRRTRKYTDARTVSCDVSRPRVTIQSLNRQTVSSLPHCPNNCPLPSASGKHYLQNPGENKRLHHV